MMGSHSADYRGRLKQLRALRLAGDDPLESLIGVHYHPMSGDEYARLWTQAIASRASGAGRDRIVLYIHIPFCPTICSFCSLAVEKMPRRSLVSQYLNALDRDLALWRSRLAPIEVSSIHIGGGTPSLLSADELTQLLSAARTAFDVPDQVEIGIELQPNTATADRLDALAAAGSVRLSLGVQSFEPDVLKRSNRGYQTTGHVTRAIQAARAAGLTRFNLDILAGLPGQGREDFLESVRVALSLAPPTLSVNRFMAENSHFARFGYAPSREDSERVSSWLLEADALVRAGGNVLVPDQPLRRGGYGAQYVLEAVTEKRYFQEDMNGPTSVLALGVGGLSHLHGVGFAIAAGERSDYVEAVGVGSPPEMLVAPVDGSYEQAAFIARGTTLLGFDERDFERVFGKGLPQPTRAKLNYLVRQDLMALDGSRWRLNQARRFDYMDVLAFLDERPALEAEAAQIVEGRVDLRRLLAERAPRGLVGQGWLWFSPQHDVFAPGQPLYAAYGDIVDDGSLPVSAFEGAVAALDARGAQVRSLWTTPDRPLAGHVPGIDTVFLGLGGANGAGVEIADVGVWTDAARECVFWASVDGYDGDGARVLLARAQEAGASLLLQTSEVFALDDASQLSGLARRAGVDVAVVHANPAARLQEYRTVDYACPPSIVSGRISQRAAVARRGHTRRPFDRFVYHF